MSTTTPTKWPGTTELRELRRVQKVGKQFVTEWRAGGHKKTGWFEVVRDGTRLRDRWIWADTHIPDRTPELEELRAEVAGLIIVETFADGSQSAGSQSWFNNAAAQDAYEEGWYFDHECLADDGWIVAEGTTKATDTSPARTWKGWKKP